MKWHKNSKNIFVNFNVVMQAILTDVWDFVKNQILVFFYVLSHEARLLFNSI